MYIIISYYSWVKLVKEKKKMTNITFGTNIIQVEFCVLGDSIYFYDMYFQLAIVHLIPNSIQYYLPVLTIFFFFLLFDYYVLLSHCGRLLGKKRKD